MQLFFIFLALCIGLVQPSSWASSDYGLIIQDRPEYDIWESMPRSVELSGVIVDNSGAPLANASISYGDEHILTDALGHFSIKKRVSPKLQVTITHPQFIPLKTFVAGIFNPHGMSKIQLTKLDNGIEVSESGFFSESDGYSVQAGPNTFQHETRLLVGTQLLRDSYEYTGWPELQRRAAFYIKPIDSSPILKPITLKLPIEYGNGLVEPVLLHRYNTAQSYSVVSSDVLVGDKTATVEVTEPGFYAVADYGTSIIPEPSFLTADYNGDGFVSPHDALVTVQYSESNNYSLQVKSPERTFTASVYKKGASSEIISSFMPTNVCNVFPLKDASFSSMDTDIPGSVYSDILLRTGYDKPIKLGGASDIFQYPHLAQAVLMRMSSIALLDRAAITSLERDYLKEIISGTKAGEFVKAKVIGNRYANLNAGDIIYITILNGTLSVFKASEQYVIKAPERLIYFNCTPTQNTQQKIAKTHPELPYSNHTQFRFTREGNVLSIDYHPLEAQKPKSEQAFCGAVTKASYSHSAVNTAKVVHEEYNSLKELSADVSYGARLTNVFTDSYIPANAESIIAWESNNRNDSAHHTTAPLTAQFTLQPWKRVLSLDSELKDKRKWREDGNIAFAVNSDSEVFLRVVQKDNTAKYYKAGRPQTVRNNIGFVLVAMPQTACKPSEIKEAMKQQDIDEPVTITIEPASATLEAEELEKTEESSGDNAEAETEKPKRMPLISLPKFDVPDLKLPSFELPSFSGLFSSDEEEEQGATEQNDGNDDSPEIAEPKVEATEREPAVKEVAEPVQQEAEEPSEVVEGQESKVIEKDIITLKNTDVAISSNNNPSQEPSYIEIEPMSSPLFEDEVKGEAKISRKKEGAIIDTKALADEIESWLDF